ncbi:TPA: site-2 protease family protein [Bacillus cereus]
MMSYIGLILFLVCKVFIAGKIIVLIHELGHAFFVFLTGNQVTAIQIGGKKKLFEIGKLQFLTGAGGRCYFEIDDSNERKFLMKNLISIGGVLFTSILAIVLVGTGSFDFYHLAVGVIKGDITFIECVTLFCFLDLRNLIPKTFIDNQVEYQTDGYKVKQDTKSYFRKRRIRRLQKNIMNLAR